MTLSVAKKVLTLIASRRQALQSQPTQISPVHETFLCLNLYVKTMCETQVYRWDDGVLAMHKCVCGVRGLSLQRIANLNVRILMAIKSSIPAVITMVVGMLRNAHIRTRMRKSARSDSIDKWTRTCHVNCS